MTADSTTAPTELVFRVFNEIGIIAQLSGNAFERVMPDGMTLAQFTVLNHFVRLGGSKRPSDLARAFQVTKATMTSTLQRMEPKGLVAIVPDDTDGRGRKVTITDAGRAMRADCIARLAPVLAAVLSATGEAAFAESLAPLARIRETLDRMRD
ncbi:MarR family transcriptional regulator [Phreatobacter sp.]|uniref:MarR family winged helix-turn-helix transcriptional regulator n=1 Tax=Phreatobacter sp. TaxID=1966341 RepID=UPI0022C3C13E|nr:MarR family transcriptional regulator [Phreatobacter sp.]MCZ8313624.1 MarR family transcriptional regulator [Phreatobacter sp.]